MSIWVLKSDLHMWLKLSLTYDLYIIYNMYNDRHMLMISITHVISMLFVIHMSYLNYIYGKPNEEWSTNCKFIFALFPHPISTYLNTRTLGFINYLSDFDWADNWNAFDLCTCLAVCMYVCEGVCVCVWCTLTGIPKFAHYAHHKVRATSTS